jgi:hypothetical protein
VVTDTARLQLIELQVVIINSYLCTHGLNGTVCNAFDAGSIHYEGKLEEVGPWKSKLRLFWALLNVIEPIGECHLEPKRGALLKEIFVTYLQKWEGLKIMLLRETADDRTI